MTGRDGNERAARQVARTVGSQLDHHHAPWAQVLAPCFCPVNCTLYLCKTMEDSLVSRRPKRSTAGNRMEAALAEFKEEELGMDVDEDADFAMDKGARAVRSVSPQV